MVVPEQHHIPPLVLVAVPGRVLGGVEPCILPNPIPLDDLGGGLQRHFTALDGLAARTVGDMFDAPWITGPLGAIAVAVLLEAVLGAIIGVSFVRGTTPTLRWRRVLIERTICGVGSDPKRSHQPQCDRSGLASLPTEISPTAGDWIGVPVILDVQRSGEAKLMIVAGALRASSGLLCPCQCRQQHPCKYGDDGNDHQKLNQGESPSR